MDNMAKNLHEEREQKSGRIISTIIIVLFLIHPTITKSMFSAFR
jgi:hypothetical protein